MATVIDYAWGRPSYASLQAIHAVAVCRYLAYLPNGKCLTRAEADGLRANGIDVISNWEQAGSWAEYSGGRTAGRTHATEAQKQHLACGGPAQRPIYFSTDWDATTGQLPTVAEYYRGAAEVVGLARTGAYGSYRTIKYLFDVGVISYGWQTYAWSGGQWDARAQLRQVQNGITVGGVDCDRNTTQADDFGQWGYVAGDVDMTPEEHNWLKETHGWVARSVEVLGAFANMDDHTWTGPVKMVTALEDMAKEIAVLSARKPAEFTDAQMVVLAAAIQANQKLSPETKATMLEICKQAAREGSGV